MPGARPGGLSRGRDDVFDERSVEARVVGDDEVRADDELRGGRDVDGLPGEILVGEARDARDLGRHRPARVLAPGTGLGVEDVGDGALEGVREGEHRELDDGVALGVEAGGLAVDVEPAAPWARAGRVGLVLEDEGVKGASLRRVDGSGRGCGCGAGRGDLLGGSRAG